MSLFSRKHLLLSLILYFSFTVFIVKDVWAAGVNQKYAAIVVNAQTGQVLYERYADKPLYPASLAKMMTIYLALENLEKGKWGPNTKLFVSQRAENQEPTKLGLSKGARISVIDAIKALIIKSANDIAVVVAENHSGTEHRFAQKMTQKAKELGMHRTVFKNASGLPDKNQFSTAKDMAVLAAALMRDFPQYFHLFNLQSFTYNGVKHRSHNRLVGQYRGMDGMKTGYIRASGFNLVSTAQRDGKRLIGVVFGGRTPTSRNDHMVSLMNRGFAMVNQGVSVTSASFVPEISSDTLRPPVPIQKPFGGDVVASVDTAIDTSVDEESAVLNNEEFLGQGSAEVKKNTIVALPKEKPDSMDVASYGFAFDRKPVTKDYPSRYKKTREWGIQVGAFTSRVKSDYAIRQAQQKLPHLLESALKRTVSAKQEDGSWVFRARLTGLDRKAALQACKHLDDCLVIQP